MNDNNFGYNLKYLRKCFSLNQEELAKISGWLYYVLLSVAKCQKVAF